MIDRRPLLEGRAAVVQAPLDQTGHRFLGTRKAKETVELTLGEARGTFVARTDRALGSAISSGIYGARVEAARRTIVSGEITSGVEAPRSDGQQSLRS